jgi:hypothetical protein
MTTPMTAALETYRLALTKSPLSTNTSRAYESRVGGYLAWLACADLDGDPSARDWAVRDYRAWLKIKRESKAPMRTLNAVDVESAKV